MQETENQNALLQFNHNEQCLIIRWGVPTSFSSASGYWTQGLGVHTYSHHIHILTLTVWHSEMKDILVLLCCVGLMVNNTFIFITVRVCVCVPHFLLRQLLRTFEILCQLLDWAGGITHLPQILHSLVVLGFAADLMRVEGFVVVNFSIHPKEEEKVLHRGGRGKKNKVASLSFFSWWKGMTTNT